MADFNTIHFFKYGETQFISGSVNYKQPTVDTVSAADLLADITSNRPAEKLEEDYIAVHIFNRGNVRYTSNTKSGSFDFPVTDLDETKLSAYTTEMLAAYSASLG